MRKRADKDHEIIIKRRSKKGHADEHSSAWKVAFADFTLAMMALFMVLWIVQPRNEMQSSASSDQQNNPLVDGGAGVFDGTSKTPLDLDGVPVTVSRKVDAANDADKPQDAEPAAGARKHYGTPEQMQELARLMEAVALQVDALANVEVEVVPQGLRVLIRDDQQRFMFQRGSAVLNPHFQGLLGALAGVLAKVDNKLIISGHTDATQYREKAGYNNWNLSGDRALRARNVLVESGLPAAGILQVTAQADVMPLRPDDPENGANRRIELLLLTTRAEALYRELFGEGSAQARYSEGGSEFIAPTEKAAL
ncbi:OmpA family protein [Zestomonas carbonaria]|uniref:Chemotaxis protein LafU n=1 Tax=Zestomonas carbonaria TaxID=2762745 RepID=A0A7U7ESA3_9GAMM|nr:OmpA family protein [Pseudomonas carbonaria]CAD5110223.1 Chemotaxis protein LafU [Pseudomonas carbonaria]